MADLGSHILNRAGLAVMRELWQWREDEAIAANRPPFFLFSRTRRWWPSRKPPPRISRSNRSSTPSFAPAARGIAKAIKAAFLRPPDTFPQILRNRTQRPSEAERKRYQVLEERRDAAAHSLGLDATIIASRSVLGDLARDWDKHAPELMKWQRQLLTA